MQVLIEFVQLLMSGVSQVASFLTTLPSLVSTMVTAFPPVLSVYLLFIFCLVLILIIYTKIIRKGG